MPFLFDLEQFATTKYRERICGRGIDYSWRGRWHCSGWAAGRWVYERINVIKIIKLH